MKRRRAVAGMFALVAMTFALAETVLASSCMPGMGPVAAMSHATDGAAPADGGPASDRGPASGPHASHAGASHVGTPDDGTGSTTHHGSGDDGETQCPFGPVMAVQGCATAASLPTNPVGPLTSSSEGVAGVFAEQVEHDLLLGTAFFRPPRS